MEAFNSPGAVRYAVVGAARMEGGRLVIWNPVAAPSRPT
jgi:hypothetical protein